MDDQTQQNNSRKIVVMAHNQPSCNLQGFLRDVRVVPKKKSDTVLFNQATSLAEEPFLKWSEYWWITSVREREGLD